MKCLKIVSFVVMPFYSLEEKTMLAQVPRLKFYQGFSKSFYSFAKEPGKGQVTNTPC